MRPLLALALLGALVCAAACGGGSNGDGTPVAIGSVETTETGAGASLPEWVEAKLAKPGPDVGLVFSTSDYAPGSNRVGFLVVRDDGSVVESPRAALRVGAENATAAASATASLMPVGLAGGETEPEGDTTELYVATLDLPGSGRYWIVVEPEGEELQAVGALDVRSETRSPPVGSVAIPSDNPTLADAPAVEITTATPPDTELLRYSIADALSAGEPFVAVFATPKYCQSRTCGPTVDVVDEVRERFEEQGIRFIHVEIYEGNDPSNGVNQWVREWGLPTEPWVFVVDGEGVIRAKFEGSVSVDELEQAVRASLL
jgi:hypothetical protein